MSENRSESSSVTTVKPPGGLAHVLQHAFDPAMWAAEALGFVCDPWQARMLRSTSARLLLNCSRQSGKSTVIAILAAHTAIFQRGSLILLFSPTQRQSGLLFAKISDLLKRLGNDVAGLATDNLSSCTLKNGSRIVSLPGDPDSSRGYSAPTLVVFDEGAFVSDGLFNAVRPMLAVSQGRLAVMSTPHGKRGFFFHAWKDEGDTWHRERVTAHECPRITAEEIEEVRRTSGDYWVRQEYMCEFVDTQDQLFSGESIEAAIAPEVGALPLLLTYGARDKWTVPAAARPVSPEEQAEADAEATGVFIAGVDLGQTRDYSVLCISERVEIEPPPVVIDMADVVEGRTPWSIPARRSRPEPVVHHRIRFLQRFKLNTAYPRIASDLVSAFKQLSFGEARPLWVDATGVGKAVVDSMRDAGLNPIAATITGGVDYHIQAWDDVRAPKRQLVGLMQILLQTRRLKIAADIPELRTFLGEMESFTVKLSNSGFETYEAWRKAPTTTRCSPRCWRCGVGSIPFAGQ